MTLGLNIRRPEVAYLVPSAARPNLLAVSAIGHDLLHTALQG